MNIDMPTMKVAMRIFETRYGSKLYELLNDLTKRERKNLMRYGKLSKRVLEESKNRLISLLSGLEIGIFLKLPRRSQETLLPQ